MRKKLPIISILIIVMLGLLTTVGGILGNLASGEIPSALTKYLGYVWPALGVVTSAVIVLTVWQYLRQADNGDKSISRSEHHQQLIEKQNRQRMLAKVHAFWIKGLLERSLHGAALIALGLHEQPDAIANPWRLDVQELEHTASPLPSGTNITQVYDDAGGELLILGPPGSGKTTLLLELARELLRRAQKDDTHTMPVIFNLSSWAVKRQSLADWLVEELDTKYHVPPNVGQSWIDNQDVLPLLDGLDEVRPAHRPACVEAIYDFRKKYGLVQMVVTSRSADYLRQKKRVPLHSAVTVQPLTDQQIDEYLSSAERQLAPLRVAIRNDPVLRELAATPLMLDVMALAYQGQSVEELLKGSPLETRRRTVFTTYVQRMFHRRGADASYTQQQTMHWLTWLAKQMEQHNQTEFYIERMQPNWLSDVLRHHIYQRFAMLLPGILIGGIIGVIFTIWWSGYSTFNIYVSVLILGLAGYLIARKSTALPSEERGQLTWKGIWRYLMKNWWLAGNGLLIGFGAVLSAVLSYGLLFVRLYMTATGLNYGVLVGLVFGVAGFLLSVFLGKRKKIIKPTEIVSWSSRGNKRGIFLGERKKINVPTDIPWSEHMWNGLVIGLVFGASKGLHDILAYGVSPEWGIGMIFLLAGILLSVIIGTLKNTIKPTEIVIWSLRNMMRNLFRLKHIRNGVIVGLSVGLSVGLDVGLNDMLDCGDVLSDALSFGLTNYGLSAGLGAFLIYWLLLGLFRGLSSDILDKKRRVRPNQGIWLSARNSVLVGIFGGLIGILSYAFSNLLTFSLAYGLSEGLKQDLNDVLRDGLLFGLACALLSSLLIGGLACLQHIILRLLLWRAGCAPLNYPRFLDYAADRILLYKVGGGYIFIHRLLQDHIASLDTAR
jgi:DNA polymerase III delta prime subunit